MTNFESIKIQKLLQTIGFDSRRKIREWIQDGEFRINDKTITDPNYLVNPKLDIIIFREEKVNIRRQVKKSYFIFNKPDGVVSTLSDPQKRPAISDFITKIKERVYPVGRLDFHSEGLILLTNDGDLTNFIISPKNKIPKTYLLKIKGILSAEKINKLRSRGAVIDGRRITPAQIRTIKKIRQSNSWIRVIIFEGKKHILRKLFKYSGHPVEKLKRTAIGTIQLKKLPSGHWRELTAEEITSFNNKFDYEGKEPISKNKINK